MDKKRLNIEIPKTLQDLSRPPEHMYQDPSNTFKDTSKTPREHPLHPPIFQQTPRTHQGQALGVSENMMKFGHRLLTREYASCHLVVPK